MPGISIPTGFKRLDLHMDGGFKRGELSVILGRPSIGKTAFALSICKNIGIENNIAVGFFSLNSRIKDIHAVLWSAIGRVDLHRIKGGFLTETDKVRIAIVKKRLEQTSLFIEDTFFDESDLEHTIRRLHRERKLQLIFVDSVERLHNLSYLRNLARALECPVVITTSNLEIIVQKTVDKVLILRREEYDNPTSENRSMANIEVFKKSTHQATVPFIFFKGWTSMRIEEGMI